MKISECEKDKRNYNNNINFHFSGTDKAYVEKSVGNLSSSKEGTFKNISTKCL